MKNNNLTKITSISLLFVMLFLSACGKEEEEKKPEEAVAPISVATRSVKDSKQLEETLEFPGLISSEQEAKIIAKTGGTIKGFKVATGDKISTSQLLARIDDAKGGASSGINTSQIRQAQIGAAQAESSLRLAENNYNNTLTQAERDLAQVEIAKGQAGSGKNNLSLTSAEAIKSATIGLEQAKLATESAKSNLDKQKKIISESGTNSQTNARLNIATVIDNSKTLIDNINSITSFDNTKGVSISYRNNLAALNSDSYLQAKASFEAARKEYDTIGSLSASSDLSRAEEAIRLATAIKKMTDATKVLFENSVSGGDLPESSALGISLSGLKAQVSGYQSSANSLLTLANGAKQSLIGTDLGGDLNLSNLEKAYELAKKQEESANQALINLKAGNKSQADQAEFGVASADNQYESSKNRLDLQKQVAKSQVDIARLTYQNALTALEGLYDVHEAISPIEGVLTSKLVNDGETVSAGQELATVSRPDKLKLEFFIDEENIKYIKLGDKAEIKDNSGKTFAAKISSLTPQADALSKRFAVEVRPDKVDSNAFSLGTIMTAVIKVKKSAQKSGNLILPLSAIEVSQNDSSIFIISGGIAKKEKVTIERVIGEAAEIKTSLKDTDIIIVDGIKNIREGDAVEARK